MKLVIVSHTPHYQKGEIVVGWGPTVREINYLSRVFNQIVHIAPFRSEKAPESSLAYESNKIHLRPVPPAGGPGFHEKIGILVKMPVYWKTMQEEFRGADVIHVRCPANISLLAIVLLAWAKNSAKRWIKYAGNWNPEGKEPWSYRFQRWCLKKNFPRAVVTVNGEWPDQPQHIHSFLNPCLSEKEIEEARRLIKGKKIVFPLRLLFVGRLETEKGAGRCLQIADNLKKEGIEFHLDLVGDGCEMKKFEIMAENMKLQKYVTFHGWLSRSTLNESYRTAHFILLPTSASEGWPKVISEAMAYGAVPIAGRVSSIPGYLEQWKIGSVCNSLHPDSFAETILKYIQNPNNWKIESEKASCQAALFTYENYLQAIRKIIPDISQ